MQLIHKITKLKNRLESYPDVLFQAFPSNCQQAVISISVYVSNAINLVVYFLLARASVIQGVYYDSSNISDSMINHIDIFLVMLLGTCSLFQMYFKSSAHGVLEQMKQYTKLLLILI